MNNFMTWLARYPLGRPTADAYDRFGLDAPLLIHGAVELGLATVENRWSETGGYGLCVVGIKCD